MAKSPKLDLFEKLSELKAWQSKHQEKLLAQQKEQQGILKRQQIQQMNLFESRNIGVPESQNHSATRRNLAKDPNWRNHDETSLRSQDSRRNEEDGDMGDERGKVSLDEMPVKCPNVQFEELVEEKLKEIEVKRNEAINDKRPKRQFLRKGEGLKRFHMKSPNEFMKIKPVITSNVAKSCSRKCSTNASTSSHNGNTANSSIKTLNSKSKAEEQGDDGLNANSKCWSHVLNQEQRGCSTKVEKVPKHEAEDLKVFELLEQMAVDSSFCSSSSTLLGFMESPIISTPLKAILEHKKMIKDLKSPKHLPFGMDVSDEETDEFASSTESYSSENETVGDEVKDAALPHTSPRVRFSSHVEEREFDSGIEKLNPKRSLSGENDFKDTEEWSESDDESNAEVSCEVAESNEPIDNVVVDKEKEECRPSSEKDLPISSTSGMSRNENRKSSSEIILKSELLHRKLLELEQEIEIFRKENEELCRKKQLQKQAEEKWLKEKREIEERLKEKEEELRNITVVERQKLNREKRVFETYSKKTSEKASSHQEVENLQKKLAELQLELREKERKNSAAYNRISNRVKALQKENSELKEEIDKLKKEKKVQSKKSTDRLIGSKKSIGNTKALHQINEELTRTNPVGGVVKEGAVESQCLLREEPLEEELKSSEDAGNGVSLQRMQNASNVLHKSYKGFADNDEDSGRKLELKDINGGEAALTDITSANFIPQVPVRLREETKLIGTQSLGRRANNCAANSLSQYHSASTTFSSEKTNSDGSREIRYENGNFKMISPDGLNIKLFYFNGDVKETLSDGTIKYYYSETRTWHTTFPDGLEILEFPNGQVERHFQGTVEVAFPDATVRIIQSDGREELRLPDGTNIVANTNGDKIVSFPNGQKEYQTNDFKKRVYPDGTVKILYSDGVQETRYSNGRVRLKDAAGSLLMDTQS